MRSEGATREMYQCNPVVPLAFDGNLLGGCRVKPVSSISHCQKRLERHKDTMASLNSTVMNPTYVPPSISSGEQTHLRCLCGRKWVLANEERRLSSESGASIGTRSSRWVNKGECAHPSTTCRALSTFMGLAPGKLSWLARSSGGSRFTVSSFHWPVLARAS